MKKLILISIILFSVALAFMANTGCEPTVIDADGDGYASDVDCNDNHAGIYPGALDICGDGIDQDCSGGDTPCGGGGDECQQWTSTNSQHVSAGRAYTETGSGCDASTTYYAIGSQENLGTSASTTTTLKTDDGQIYVKGSCSGDDDVVQADNPLFRNFRSADPSPLVHNGRYYIVCGQDEVNTNAFNMYAWRLLSSADMSTWTDHGVILRPGDVSWMPNSCAWASCITYRNGYFYFYAANCEQIGVLRSTSITGPYQDVLGRPLINSSTPEPDSLNARDIDPMCYIDDDGQAYLFWGGDGVCRYVKLNSNMISLSGSVMDVPGLTDPNGGYSYLEAPFVIKDSGTYFMIYADRPWPSEIHYATAGSINGPWTHRGVIGTPTGTGTNHSGAAYFNGRWWYAYHTEELSNGNAFSRSVCVDPMTVSGGRISPIVYSSFD